MFKIRKSRNILNNVTADSIEVKAGGAATATAKVSSTLRGVF